MRCGIYRPKKLLIWKRVVGYGASRREVGFMVCNSGRRYIRSVATFCPVFPKRLVICVCVMLCQVLGLEFFGVWSSRGFLRANLLTTT